MFTNQYQVRLFYFCLLIHVYIFHKDILYIFELQTTKLVNS